ncbi:hypothetical protein LINPERHAP2_LOCUS19387 [Linum perenne]
MVYGRAKSRALGPGAPILLKTWLRVSLGWPSLLGQVLLSSPVPVLDECF